MAAKLRHRFCFRLVIWYPSYEEENASADLGFDMDTVVLDSNIYDRLELDVETRELLSKFVTQGMLQVISTPRIRRELEESPLQGIPDWFPVVQELESVSILPFRLGETRLGKGEVFRAHLGESAKRADAEITDSANAYADVFVTDDRRCRKRAQECAPLCKTLTYPDFKAWLCKFRAK